MAVNVNQSSYYQTHFTQKLLTVQVDNLRLRAYIGYQEWEKNKLQDIVISYSFKYNGARATENDNVDYAVNYKTLTKRIIALIDHQSFDLIEAMAEVIFKTIEDFDISIQEIQVCLEKPHALRFADNVMVKISSLDRLQVAMVSLGSNINPDENFAKALNYLTGLGTIVHRTDFIQTKPLKFTDQADFLNGAILLHTHLSQPMLELKLKQIEALMGRVRNENKNAPRVIDLDVVTYKNKIIDKKELQDLPFLKNFIEKLQPELLSKKIDI